MIFTIGKYLTELEVGQSLAGCLSVFPPESRAFPALMPDQREELERSREVEVAASALSTPRRPAPSRLLARIGWLLLALILGVLAVGWVVQNELIHSSIQVGNSVPPIPALAAILLLGGSAALVRRAGARSKPRTQTAVEADPARAPILAIYLFLAMAAAVVSTASMSFFFAFITVPTHQFPAIAQWFPAWFAPADKEAVESMYRGTWGRGVPWQVWAMPLLAWGSFLFVLMVTLFAALSLLRRPWMEAERLAYPMVQIPLRLLDGDSVGRSSPPLWRDPVMWIGFGLEAAFDGINMLHTRWPSVPALGTQFDVGALFPDRPWSSLSPFQVSYRPEIFGIGYLMPTDVLLTTAFSYLALRLSTVFRVATGEVVPSTAYDYQELGIGAFLALFGLLMWRAKPSLKASFLQAFGRSATQPFENSGGGRPGTQPSAPDPSSPRTPGRLTGPDEPLSARAAWLIVILGTAAMLAWLCAAGLALWLGALHLLVLMAVAIVYARMRAETGAPMIFLFPFWQQQMVLTNCLGTEWMTAGNMRSFAVFNALGGLSRGFYPEICAYGSEGMSLAARARFPQRWVTAAIIGGLALGLGLGGYLYLTAYYHSGALLLDGGGGHGGYRIYLATQQYEQTTRAMAAPFDPKPDRIVQTLLGAGLAVAFGLLRQRLLWFPLHPMGFAMASAYGYHLWGPFLAVWLLKTLILRLGGHTTYRRLIPLFLGVALGRYLFAGIFWGFMGLIGSPVTESYALHFG